MKDLFLHPIQTVKHNILDNHIRSDLEIDTSHNHLYNILFSNTNSQSKYHDFSLDKISKYYTAQTKIS